MAFSTNKDGAKQISSLQAGSKYMVADLGGNILLLSYMVISIEKMVNVVSHNKTKGFFTKR